MTTSTRFYKPTTAWLTDKEVAFLNKPNAPIIATVMTRRVAMQHLKRPEDFTPEYLGMGPFQITYNFSSAIRNNLFASKTATSAVNSIAGQRQYGASGWSFRTLYEFLTDYHNGGYPFIDTYFQQIFKSRPVYRRFSRIYEDVREDIAAEQFDLYQEGNTKTLANLKVWQDPIIKQGCRDVANDIRADIVRCLYSGRIPMSHRPGKSGSLGSTQVSISTGEARKRLAGMRHPTRLFFASGQLIAHLNIFVQIARGANKEGRAVA